MTDSAPDSQQLGPQESVTKTLGELVLDPSPALVVVLLVLILAGKSDAVIFAWLYMKTLAGLE